MTALAEWEVLVDAALAAPWDTFFLGRKDILEAEILAFFLPSVLDVEILAFFFSSVVVLLLEAGAALWMSAALFAVLVSIPKTRRSSFWPRLKSSRCLMASTFRSGEASSASLVSSALGSGAFFCLKECNFFIGDADFFINALPNRLDERGIVAVTPSSELPTFICNSLISLARRWISAASLAVKDAFGRVWDDAATMVGCVCVEDLPK
mmetsp:Transcript_23016/g.54570  ORF Transcript_23016/g.54570 Transcript_23016/m.54570 type:complete len:209 (-) Transcript_23016:78-704(-)